MSDVKCPYCGSDQNINHDDGYGYEDRVYEQSCTLCNKNFKFTTDITYVYEVSCQDSDHNMQQSPILDHSDMWSCDKCDYYEVRRDV